MRLMSVALMDSIKADHGFNMDSKSVRNLLQAMSEFAPQERRDFLQFVTGSPKLPIGGKLEILIGNYCIEYLQKNRIQGFDATIHSCVQAE